jgi:hypothetical protein
MKTYQHFATVLAQFLGSDTAIRLTVNGYMPLSIAYKVMKKLGTTELTTERPTV